MKITLRWSVPMIGPDAAGANLLTDFQRIHLPRVIQCLTPHREKTRAALERRAGKSTVTPQRMRNAMQSTIDTTTKRSQTGKRHEQGDPPTSRSSARINHAEGVRKTTGSSTADTAELGTGAAEAPQPGIEVSRTTAIGNRGSKARYRDEEGIPVIPGLDDGAMICFGDRVNLARNCEIDSAIAVLDGLRKLCQHHPALKPEIAALEAMGDAWEALTKINPASFEGSGEHLDTCPTAIVRAFKRRVEAARDAKLETALYEIAELDDLVSESSLLTPALNQIGLLVGMWGLLFSGEVMERHRRL